MNPWKELLIALSRNEREILARWYEKDQAGFFYMVIPDEREIGESRPIACSDIHYSDIEKITIMAKLDHGKLQISHDIPAIHAAIANVANIIVTQSPEGLEITLASGV
uniref:hypothetical protein n=1 Tax=Thaumasiovibrio occultus TaxID=1891184 RepID=UPI000B34DC07|nr:hypothetical protein [Thaumasiovibrio occultus]